MDEQVKTLMDALSKAVLALNSAPRFKVSSENMDSYQIAAQCTHVLNIAGARANVQTRDIGLAIRDFCIDRHISVFTEDIKGNLTEHESERSINSINAHDPTNLIFSLDNGQEFIVKVIAVCS